MDLRVDASIEGCDRARAERGTQFVERAAARVGQHDVELAEACFGQIRNRMAIAQARRTGSSISLA